MEPQALHDLTAAYALDALDPGEEREYEQHLLVCPRCRDELAELRDVAGALAFGVPAPAPDPALRQRILDSARGERSNVIPLRRRGPFQAAVGAASLAAAAAVALAFWATSLSGDLDRERSAGAMRAAVLELVSDPGARHLPVVGTEGTLIVSSSERAALVLDGLAKAPEGKSYMAWVVERDRPVPAGRFDSLNGHAELVLSEEVPRGALVQVTLEEPGVTEPHGQTVASAQTV